MLKEKLESISKDLYNALKETKMYGIFINDYQPLKLPPTFSYSKMYGRLQKPVSTEKLHIGDVYEVNCEPVQNAKLIEFFIQDKKIEHKFLTTFTSKALGVEKILDIYLGEYFNKHKEQYKLKRPIIFYEMFSNFLICMLSITIGLALIGTIFGLKILALVSILLIMPIIYLKTDRQINQRMKILKECSRKILKL